MPKVDEDVVVVPRIEPERYSWHRVPWTTLTSDLTRLPHALLLHGQAGLGKNAFAMRLAQALLCRSPTEDTQACGKCQSCVLFRSGNHPDFLRVEPLEDSNRILVDQVRDVIEFLAFKPHTATRKIVVISPAEAMNVNAANSLLKVLEEPPAGTLLILVAAHLSRVSVTVRSRCTRVAFNPPPLPEALTWFRSQSVKPDEAEALLALAGGAPLAALTFATEGYAENHLRLSADLTALAQRRSDPVACAERWKGIGAQNCLEWLHRFTVSQIRSHAGSSTHDINMVQFLSETKSYAITIIDLHKFIDSVSIAKRQLGTGMDETLVLEDLLIRWSEMTVTAD